MEVNKSLDEVSIITAVLSDVQTQHNSVLTLRAIRLTTQKVIKRTTNEGLGFLTKTLPRLGKSLDKALANHEPLDAIKLGY